MRTRLTGGTKRTGTVRTALSLAVVLAIVAAILGAARQGAAQDALAGDYTAIFGSEELDQDIANAPALAGRWRLSFAEDGTYEAERLDVGVLVTGTYEVEGDTVTVTDEGGVLSCASPVTTAGAPEDVSTGTYRFEVDSGRLLMSVEEDGCDLRRIFFASKEFAAFIACATLLAGEGASPVAVEDNAGESTPVPEGGLLDILTPAAGAGQDEDDADDPQDDAEDDEEAAPSGDTEDQIDELLGQMTACWSTGNPARFLPLLGEEFRGQFEDPDALDQLQTTMTVPISWERAGEIDDEGDNRVSAVVRTTALGEEEFVRLFFVFEDDEWRWAGSEAS